MSFLINYSQPMILGFDIEEQNHYLNTLKKLLSGYKYLVIVKMAENVQECFVEFLDTNELKTFMFARVEQLGCPTDMLLVASNKVSIKDVEQEAKKNLMNKYCLTDEILKEFAVNLNGIVLFRDNDSIGVKQVK